MRRKHTCSLECIGGERVASMTHHEGWWKFVLNIRWNLSGLKKFTIDYWAAETIGKRWASTKVHNIEISILWACSRTFFYLFIPMN
jgi:hypothetical protein